MLLSVGMKRMTSKTNWLGLWACLAAALWVAGCEKKSDVQKTEDKAKTSTQQAADAIKDAAQKTGEAIKDNANQAWDATREGASNVAGKVKEGAQKVGEVATNIVGDIKKQFQ